MIALLGFLCIALVCLRAPRAITAAMTPDPVPSAYGAEDVDA